MRKADLSPRAEFAGALSARPTQHDPSTSHAPEMYRLSAATFHPHALRSNGNASQIAAISICSLSALAAIFYVAPMPSLFRSEPVVAFAPDADPSKGTIATAPPTFEIVFSDGDRGLMVYGGYVYVVRLGDRLPDGRRAIGFEKREGSWSAMTL